MPNNTRTDKTQLLLSKPSAHLCKKDEVLEASVEMGFDLQVAHLHKVCVIYVCIYTKQALENALDDVHKIRRER
jgi:hypothetical protein